MARLLARNLTLAHPAPTSLRGLATKVEIIEIDLTEEDDAAPSSQTSTDEVARIRRLEDAVHGLVVRRAAPDWLPFVPGSSFWVPPARPPPGVAEFMKRIAAAGSSEGPDEDGAVEVVEFNMPVTKAETLSFSTARGWPSMSFLKGTFPYSTKKTWKGATQTWKGATQTDDEES